MRRDLHWVGTWTPAPAPAEGAAFSNHILRMNTRASIGGDALRVRLSNAYGSRKLVVGAARIALRHTGPGIVPGVDRKLTFGGADTTTIAAGALLLSDPVSLQLPPLCDLAISVYLPGDLPASFGIRVRRTTSHRRATLPLRSRCRSASLRTIGISSAGSMCWPRETLAESSRSATR
jgi:hypothetical protein